MEKEPNKETSRLALAAISCVLIAIGLWFVDICLNLVGAYGIAGVFFALSILFFVLGFILGVVSFVVINFWRRYTKGLGWAISSVLLSALPVMVICELELGVRSRLAHKKAWSGLYNLELLGKELRKYAKGHDGYLPEADRWCDLLMEYNPNLMKENFRHPQPEIFRKYLKFDGEIQFAFNRNLGKKRLVDIPGDVVLLFEADGKWNLNGGPEVLETRRANPGYLAMYFVDGSTGDYWCYKNALRKFNNGGMYYEQPRWRP